MTEGDDECSAPIWLCEQEVTWRGKNFRLSCERVSRRRIGELPPCVDTRASIWKLYLNLSQLTLDMSCHQHSPLMKFKKASFKQKVSTAGAVKVKEPSTPSVPLPASCAPASHHDPILGSKVRAEQRAGMFSHPWAAETQIAQVEPTGNIY